MKLIIRADDIGYSEAVNYGIEKSIRDGLVGSAGVMPNMPFTKHGLDRIKDLDVCLGQHTNVCLGKPCADPARIPSLVNENGEFKSSKEHRTAFMNGEDLIRVEEAVIEVEAQYFRFKELTGREPEYFEAHAIASANLGKALEIVAKKYDLPFNNGSPVSNVAFFCGKPINQLPMDSMKADYNPFETLKNAILHHGSEDMPNVFVLHPGYVDEYLLSHSSLTLNRTKEVTMACDPMTKEWLDENHVELVRYRDIR